MKRHRGTRGNVPDYCPSADLNRIKKRAHHRRNPPRSEVVKMYMNSMYGKFAVPLAQSLEEAREPVQVWPRVKFPNFWQIVARFAKIVVRRCSAAVFKRGTI